MQEMKPIILVDHRESALYSTLNEKHARVRRTVLSIGDVVFGNVVIERKTQQDFERSIVDRRLFKQLEKMGAYEKRVFIVEQDPTYDPCIKHEALLGAYASVLLDYDASLFFSKNVGETAEIIIALWKRLTGQRREHTLVHKCASWTLEDNLLAVVELLPQIGPVAAKNLLDAFGSLNALANAKKEELLKVEGIGKKRAEILYNFFRLKWKQT